MTRLLPETDYFVRTVDLPIGIYGATMPNDDDTYSIYINNRYPDSRKLVTYVHEVRHIQNEDFWNGDDIDTIESRASI